MRLVTVARCGLVVLAAALVGLGCKSTPKVTTVPPPEVAGSGRPSPTPPPEQVVREPGAEAIPSEAVLEELPADIQELNRRGYLEDAFFDTNQYELTAEGREVLGKNAAWLHRYPTVKILIEGHCDERNTREYNLALGERRANVARDYLVSLGASADQIRTISYGEERPFANGHDESAWRLNRRVHFVITAR
jgi:peptidoglycan-associated lipoprotein